MIAATFVTTAATIFTISTLVVYRQGAQAHNDARIQIGQLLTSLADAETGQRGYLLTGDTTYLGPYSMAANHIPGQLADIITRTKGDIAQVQINKLSTLVKQKLTELAGTITLRQSGDTAAAQQVVASGTSKVLTDQIRSVAQEVQSAEAAQIDRDRSNITTLAALARDISVVSVIIVIGLSIVVYWTYLKAIQSERVLDRAKDEFVSLASHQLRTPATGIKSILSTLAAGDFGPLNDRQQYFLRRALESSERELGIIEELLNVAKADAGRLILHISTFELGGLIDTIVGEQRAAITEKQQELTVKRPSRPITLVADEEKLYMAIGNLLDNARKYTPEFGKIAITISNSHGIAKIEVADSGIGIDSEEINHIFDRFHRASEAVRDQVEGAGLGLYLASRIAQLHEGSIEVSSRLGKGTKFVMILPQGDQDAAEGAAN